MNIKQRRLELGLKQNELAEECEISSQQLCDIEKGRTKPSIQTALKLAKALGVSDINFFDEK